MTYLFGRGGYVHAVRTKMHGHFFLFNAVQKHQSVSLFHTVVHVPPLQNRAAHLPEYKMPEHQYPVEMTPLHACAFSHFIAIKFFEHEKK